VAWNYKQINNSRMQWFLSLLLIGLFGFASALSSSGNRLLVVEELEEQDKYSTFFMDLKGK
jgi:hypothetical protein